MKKLLLLLSMGSIVLSAQAQEKKAGTGKFEVGAMATKVASSNTAKINDIKEHARLRTAANKSTAITSRWYNYGVTMDTMLRYGISGNVMALAVNNIWWDTSGVLVYTSGPANNTMVSMGQAFHPQATNSFNNPNYHAGEMMLTNSEAYKIDSLVLWGDYVFNPAKLSVVDTMVVTLTQGSVTVTGDDIFFGWFTDATLVANYGAPAGQRVVFALMGYDSTTNTGAGTSAYTMKFPLKDATHPTPWYDTTSGGLWFREVALPAAYNVTAGNMVGVAISFKSGDASFITNDTLNGEYNRVRPLLAFAENSAGDAVYPPYDSTDFNSGQYKTLPNFENGWGDVYVPMYAWTSGGNASVLQHSYTDIHVVCSSCTKVVNVNEVVKNISDVKAFPNPAENEVNIAFDLKNAANATVTLTNTLGQVVATQVSNSGRASFSTSALPAGVYIYAISANGEVATGRFTVAH